MKEQKVLSGQPSPQHNSYKVGHKALERKKGNDQVSLASRVTGVNKWPQ